jgi:putative tributyrin esterase
MAFFSTALERNAEYIAFIPEPRIVGPGPYPVLVQLHGYLDDQHAWLNKSRLWERSERYPMIVVMPATHNGWWANLGRPNNWEDYVIQDLRTHVMATLPARPGSWAIGGLSMGGFGTLRLALKHPELFCSVWAHSSAIPDPNTPGLFPFVWEDPERSEASRERMKTDLSCFHWAKNIDRSTLPKISFDCGTEDYLITQNRAFHSFLNDIDLPHQYAEHPGAHTWDYWDAHVGTALRQHAEVFGIQQAPELVWGA